MWGFALVVQCGWEGVTQNTGWYILYCSCSGGFQTKKTENKWQDPTLCHYSPPWGVQSCFFFVVFSQETQTKNDKTQLSATTPPLGLCNLFFFVFFIFFGFLFPGSLLVFLSLDLTLCQFSHFRGCQLAFGWFYYLLWACGFIRKLCKKKLAKCRYHWRKLEGLGTQIRPFCLFMQSFKNGVEQMQKHRQPMNV